ncbi:MAG: DUF3987 domain-containing protein [Candidatus Cloacimonetes bacterium]|nr:DUF3987 domain-containing protein [Candidatus Cloacimonadota bacterium]
MASTQFDTEKLGLVSVGFAIAKPEVVLKPLVDVMSRIKNGSYKAMVKQIRDYAANGDNANVAKWKKNLPYFVYGVVNGTRKAENVQQCNGIVLDFDHVEDIEAFKLKAVEMIPGAKYIFRSPNDGVKVLVAFAKPVAEPKLYKLIWDSLAQEAENLMGKKPDATADMSRACFVSWDEELICTQNEALDPDMFLDSLSSVADEEGKGDARFSEAIKEIHATLEIDNQDRIVDDPGEHYVELAVEYLCGQKIKYQEWMKVCIALYNHLGDRGKDYWDKFLHNPNYPHETQENLDKLWQSLQKYPSVKIGSLFYIAGAYGWRNVIAPQSRNYSLGDYPELIRMFQDKKDVDLELSKLPKELREYVEILNQITDSSEGAKLTALLPIVASSIGNRIAICNAGAKHYCNIWAVIIGPSSISRKTTVINLALKCLDEHHKKMNKLESKERIEKSIVLNKPTQARLMNLLSINPNRVIVQTEMSAWMLEMQKNYNAGMKAEITDMFDGNDKAIAKMDVNEYIRKPAFSIIGGTTEEWFFSELKDAADQRGGFLQRLLVCFYRNIDVSKMDFSTRDSSRHEARLKDYSIILETLMELKGTHYLRLSSEASELRNTRYCTMMRHFAAQGNDPLLSYLTRIYDNYFFRFSILIFAMKNWQDIREAQESSSVAKYFNKQEIDTETANEAMYLCDYYFENTKPFIQDLAEGGKLEFEKKIVDILRKHGLSEIPHHRLLSASRMTAQEFRRCLDSLIERQGLICIERKGYQNRIERFYRLNPVLV